ncbi:hypothetical protein PG996_005631 [Apiospora saccharicola]|uniref:Tautomerase cis-CaaD-like domain-containing protein n=1 Tax=Apiospora saccharicola TaxID=335842 RepID=A0ABR1VM07_9PEZI
MPLWEIFHSMGAFTGPLDTAWLAGNITDLYTGIPNNLPDFYVNVLFFPMQAGSYFVGNKPADRLPGMAERNIQHIAIQYLDDQGKINGMLKRIDTRYTAGLTWILGLM